MVNNARKSGYIYEYRFTVLGGLKVGKTSIIDRFMNDTFTHRYRPTIEDHKTYVIDHAGNMCVCLFTDTSGSNDFPAMRRLAISKGNAFLVVYSIDNRQSFLAAKRMIKDVKKLKNKEESLKIILIANKSDLSNVRDVNYDEGESIVNELNNEEQTQADFFEVSAKENQNIDLIFMSLLNMFIPSSPSQEEEENAVESNTSFIEKTSIRRLTVRRRKKKSAQVQEREQIRLGVRKSLCHSDSNLFTNNNDEYVNNNKTANSDSDNSDSERRSSLERDRIGSTTMNLLKSKFGSLQKLFRADSLSKLKRGSNLDISTPEIE